MVPRCSIVSRRQKESMLCKCAAAAMLSVKVPDSRVAHVRIGNFSTLVARRCNIFLRSVLCKHEIPPGTPFQFVHASTSPFLHSICVTLQVWTDFSAMDTKNGPHCIGSACGTHVEKCISMVRAKEAIGSFTNELL
jgi:hypothetical protein